ncbi:twinfilin [Colletotrichum spaethianum]|uniref:Twinfilin n=1 Tax=Colletotrichum spaethianum TaxID=700344 RepID=A0AA37PEM4_9PEZI|nr:twinfilin [Colletotrichum spaethianum]GKT50888.1 twinfilin [Colletotrichum spaethianum]
MPVPQHVLNWLYSVLTSEYHDVNRTYNDVAQALSHYPSLSPRTDVHKPLLILYLAFDNGASALLVHLSGTIPVIFRGTTYRFPISIWVPHAYPRDAPLVYVTPTETMMVRPGQHVDPQGQVYHPYLVGWAAFWDKSTILDFLAILRDIFAKEPPVIARQPGQQQPPPPTPPPGLQPHGQMPPPVPPLPPIWPLVQPAIRRPKRVLHGLRLRRQKNMALSLHTEAHHPRSMRDMAPLYHLYPQVPNVQVFTEVTTPIIHLGLRARATPDMTRHHLYLQPLPRILHRHHRPCLRALWGIFSSNSSNFAMTLLLSHRSLRQILAALSLSHLISKALLSMQREQQLQHQQPPQPQLAKPAPPPDLLDEPLTLSIPSPSSIPAPPIPPNPEKDALLHQVAQMLHSLRQRSRQQNESSMAGLQAQRTAMISAFSTLQSEMGTLGQTSALLQSNANILVEALRKADSVIEGSSRQTAPDIDELLVAPTVVANQLYVLVAEEKAMGDTIFVLGRAVERGRISPAVFAKTTRSLAREWYLKKALVRKIGKGMGLTA